MKRKRWKQLFSATLSAVMALSMMGQPVRVYGEVDARKLGEEASFHSHRPECWRIVENCTHKHTVACYEETQDKEEEETEVPENGILYALGARTGATEGNLIQNGDFESGIEGWYTWSSGTLGHDENGCRNDGSIFLKNRENSWDAIAQNIKAGSIQAGETYRSSMKIRWAAQNAGNSTEVYAELQTTDTFSLKIAGNPFANTGDWHHVIGTVKIPDDYDGSQLTLWIRPTNHTADFWVDNVSLMTEAEAEEAGPFLCMVTLDPNGGELSEDSELEMEEGDTVQGLPVPVRDGYQFKGW